MSRLPAKIIWLVVLVIVQIVVPTLAMEVVGFSAAGSSASLIVLSVGLATYLGGWKLGAGATCAGALACLVATLSAGDWLWSALVMVAVAGVLGWSARWGWNEALVLLPISLAFLIAEPPVYAGTATLGGLLLSAAVFVCGWLSVGYIVLTLRPDSTSTTIAISRSRTIGFIIMLCVVTFVTTAWTVLADFGHAGGWLIMTPFLVILPYVQDAARKSVDRVKGTLIGAGIAFVVGWALPWTWILYLAGIVAAAVAFIALAKKWSYVVFVGALTPTVILLEGASSSVEETLLLRLGATVAGVAISLVAVVLSIPFYRKVAQEKELDRY